jgi:hypothetical protein
MAVQPNMEMEEINKFMGWFLQFTRYSLQFTVTVNG